MTLAVWSWVIFATSVFGLVISGQWLPYGWLVVAGPIQIIYFTYGLTTGQPGYLASAALFAVISYWNYRKARRLLERGRDGLLPPSAPPPPAPRRPRPDRLERGSQNRRS